MIGYDWNSKNMTLADKLGISCWESRTGGETVSTNESENTEKSAGMRAEAHARGKAREKGPVEETLVERFDIETYSDFSSKWSNFIRLVLCCIEAKVCKKIFVGKLLTRSTRFTCFFTAQTSIFQKIFIKLFRIFRQNLQNFVIFEFFLVIFAHILMKNYRDFANILENVEIFWILFILFIDFAQLLMEICRNFADGLENVEI